MRTTFKRRLATTRIANEGYLVDFLIALLAGLVVLALDKIM